MAQVSGTPQGYLVDPNSNLRHRSERHGVRAVAMYVACRWGKARQYSHRGPVKWVPACELKGNPVAIRWIYGLLFLTSIFAFSRIGLTLPRAGEPLSSPWASSSITAPAPTSATAHSDHARATELSAYVHLHETRNASGPSREDARAHFCGS